MPANIPRRNKTDTARAQRAAARNAVSSQNDDRSEPVGLETTLPQGNNTPSHDATEQRQSVSENQPRTDVREDVMEEDLGHPVPTAPVQANLVGDRQAYEEIRQMIQDEYPQDYDVMQQQGPIAFPVLVATAKKLLKGVETHALYNGVNDKLFLLMATTGLKRSEILTRGFTVTCTGRVILHGAEGKHEGVCLRPCCVGDNILHTLRQLGGDAWKSGLDFLYTHLQCVFSDFPVRDKDIDKITQDRIPAGRKSLAFRKPLFPLVGVDLSSCPRMNEVLSDETDRVTRAGHTLVIPVAVSRKLVDPSPDPVEAGAATSDNADTKNQTRRKARRTKSKARARTAGEMERLNALETAALNSQQTALESMVLETMALADRTIIVQFAMMVMHLANAQVHPVAQSKLLVTVVGSKAHLFCAEAPRGSDDAALREALRKQANNDGVDLNVFPGASGTCRVNYDPCDRIVVTDVAMMRDPQRKPSKILPDSLFKNIMITDGNVIKPGEYELFVVMLDPIPNKVDGFSNLLGLTLGTEFHVPSPWAPDAQKDAGQREFTHFDAFTMVRHCENPEECSHDPRLGRITLLPGVTGNMGIAPYGGKTRLGNNWIKWCKFCSGIMSVGRQVRVHCCCGGSEQKAGKKRTRPSDQDKLKKVREELEFQSAGPAWMKKNNDKSKQPVDPKEPTSDRNGGASKQPVGSEESTPGRTDPVGNYYEDKSDRESDWDNEDVEVEESDEAKDDEVEEDAESDEDDEDNGDPGPVNKH
jgi:hypothetical protein